MKLLIKRLVTSLWHLLLICSIVHANNLTLLSSFLRTYQTSACDGDYITLNCGQRTVISIVFSDYGQTAPASSSCKSSPSPSALPQILSSANRNQNQLHPKRDHCPEKEKKALQYAFWRKIKDSCKEMSDCRLKLTPSELSLESGADSCNDVTKFAEVAFKCRPNNFNNKIVCDGGKLEMKCPSPDDRIIILSAFYGAAPSGAALPECPQARVLNHESANCTAPGVTERVISLCQGRRSCTVEANSEFLSKPICTAPGALFRKSYLKISHTCISKRMLLRQFDNEKTASSTTTTTTTTTTEMPSTHLLNNQLPVSNEPLMDSVPIGHPSNDRIKLGGIAASHPTDHTDHSNCTTLPGSMQVVGYVSDWISAVAFMRKHREAFIKHIIISVLVAFVGILTVLSVRLYYQKRALKKEYKKSKHQRPGTRSTAETFDGLDFDDEENEDIGNEAEPEVDETDGNRIDSFSNPNTENIYSKTPISSRPLIYSTLRKKPNAFAQHQVHCPENQLYGYIIPPAPPLGCSWSAQQRSSLALTTLPQPLSPSHYQSLHHHNNLHQNHYHHHPNHHHHHPHPQHYTQAPKSLPPTTPSALPVISGGGIRTSGMFDFGPLHIARVASTTTTTEISPNSAANVASLDSPPPPPNTTGSASHTNSMMSQSIGFNDHTVPPPPPPPEVTSSLIITKV